MLFPYNGSKPQDLDNQTIREYAKDNIEHFSEMLKMAEEGCQNIRAGEVVMYLFLWQGVHAKAGNWDKLTPEEKNEVVSEFWDRNE